MQTAPRKYFRGAVTSAFFISSYLHFIFRHNLSCYFYLTVIYLNYQLSLIYICLECDLMSEEKRVRRTPEQIAADLDVQIEKLKDSILNSVYTRSGQNSTPNSNATNLHSSQKRCCSFCISSSNASPTFQVQKSIFHQMTKPIQVTVILPLLLAISFSRNDDIHSSISGISNDLIGVIPTIGQ